MILDYLDDLNLAAVATATVVAFVVGVTWFSPVLLGRFWARQVSRYSGIPDTDIIENASRPPVLIKWLVSIAVSAFMLSLAIEGTGTDSAADGAVLGFVLGAGLGAAFFSWPPIFARMPWQWWLLNSGAFVTMLAAMGAVLGSWR
jgi:hypothetical protein